MSERPDAKRLLGEAQRSLLQELLPGLDEAQRFQVRMVASVFGIVARETEAGGGAWRSLEVALRERLGRPDAELSALLLAVAEAVRAGRHDADERLYRALHDHFLARLAVANPKALPKP